MDSILTEANLDAGILARPAHWDRDFHNSLYVELQRLKGSNLNEAWWWYVVDVLSGWRAIRPYGKATIAKRGLERVEQLRTTHSLVLASASEQSLSLETTSWNDISRLFEVATAIKGVESPVFGSKLCHFILPNVFPPIDNYMINEINTTWWYYPNYWRHCQRHWIACTVKPELTHRLKKEIERRSLQPVTGHYPWSTKLTELCIVGKKHLDS